MQALRDHYVDLITTSTEFCDALAHEAGKAPAALRSPTEDEAYLRRRSEAEVAWLPVP